MSPDQLLQLVRGQSAMSMLGVMTEKRNRMDLQTHMTEKVAAIRAAQAFKANLEQQLHGVSTHILRLEGAVTMLRELGASLPPDMVANEVHPENQLLAKVQEARAAAAEGASEPIPRKEEPDAAEEGHE